VPKAAIFDLDGTLLDSVDLHAIAWHEAMVRFGHDVSFEQARSLQLGAIREFGGRQRDVVQVNGFTASTSAVLLLGVENG
jgi:beta-phosphoglucomutase-like phosphatase (HAD superfamily)